MADQNLPSGGGALDQIVSMLGGGSQGISNADITQALAPTLQRQQQQMPAYFTQPRREVLPPAQMNRQEVIGAGNARGRDIGNAVSASVRTLSNFAAKRDQMQQAKEARKVQTMLNAQAGMDQAQQQLATMKPGDPGYDAAKAALEQNQRVINTLFQDKKFVNSVQKGFDISLTDPSQNKTEHHNIVQKGIELFKKQNQTPYTPEQASQMAAKFAASQPVQLQPNQFTMQRLQLQMQQRKDQVELMRSILPAIVRGEYQNRNETIRQATELAKQQAANTEWDRRNAVTQQQAYQKLDYQQKLAFQRLDHENANIIGRERTRLKDEAGDPSKVLKAADDSARSWSNAIAQQQSQLDTAQQTLATYKSSSNANPAVISQMQADIDIRSGELERTRKQSSYYRGVYELKKLGVGLPSDPDLQQDGGKNGTSGSGAGISSNDLGDWSNYTGEGSGGEHLGDGQD